MTTSRTSLSTENGVSRRDFLQRTLATGAVLLVPAHLGAKDVPPINAAPRTGVSTEQDRDELFELSVAELTARMQNGSLTSRALTQRYLNRIESLDRGGPTLRSVIEINPDALAIADARDTERKAGRIRGPLHGIPILIKDNIDTADRMKTTAGSLALADNTASRDAFIVQRLREAGAVLLGKTNLSEWANFRSTRSSSGWSARGGQTLNPYVLDRNPCGSSSGTGTAISADLATVGIGTETDGSVICPAAITGLVGVKPTVGLWSRSGIIPISISQDTAGPMARTVADAAAMLAPLMGNDPRDAMSARGVREASADFATSLNPSSLKGARIGVARSTAGFNPDVDKVFGEALTAMKSAGATIVDPANIAGGGKIGDPEFDVLLYEFKEGVNAYLATTGPAVQVKSLKDVIEFNEREREREMPWFGQEIFIRAQEKTPTKAAYLKARAECMRLSRTLGIDATLAKFKLDAIVLPSNQPAWTTDHLNGDHFTGGNTTFAAVAGYPSVTVPMGTVHQLPVGISFIGPAWSDQLLMSLAYSFEQTTRARKSPGFLRTLG